jgi:hypothetical protein
MNNSDNYNLEHRTLAFSGDVIAAVKFIKKDVINIPLIS